MPPNGQFHNVNKDQMKRENDRFQGGGGQDTYGDLPMLFLQKGTTQVRVLPPYSDRGSWFKELKEHGVRVGGRYSPVTCPRQFDQPCPLCEEAQHLYGLGGEDNVDKSKKYRPRSTYFLNVLVHTAPNHELSLTSGVKIMKCGIMVLKGLLLIENDDVAGYGDITSLDNGFDIRITRTGNTVNDTKYDTRPMRERTDIWDALKVAGADPASVVPNDLDTMFVPKSYEELSGILSEIRAAPGLQPEPKAKQTEPGQGPVPDAPVETSDFKIPDPPKAADKISF